MQYVVGALFVGSIALGLFIYRTFDAPVINGTVSPYTYLEAYDTGTGSGRSAEITFTMDSSAFDDVPRSTSAKVSYPGWGRSEWLYYGDLETKEHNISVNMSHRLPGNPWRQSFKSGFAKRGAFKGANLKFETDERDLQTIHGQVNIVDFSLAKNGWQKKCIGFLSQRINSALLLEGFYCAAEGQMPKLSILKRSLNSLKAPRFALGTS